ncbi:MULTISPECIES: hypothetical protein [unclassified Duganella]|uniref:hypothetical protein n=1 Tax=unclassified Duganella TaxID=2636909 RepID=UPI000E352541|nr:MULTISPECIES: hypothetical protein [unclassified Duganella]RFP19355.1 hypothetical protein D0T23_06160 [Duganella sp. BJB475]RFP35936.1 hypothetical protein D0T21_05705 [Duganella sp. BJB476]
MNKLALLLACLVCVTTHAADSEGKTPSRVALNSPGGLLVRLTFAKGLQQAGLEAAPTTATSYSRNTPLSLAIAGAAKKDFIETGIEASRRALIECQQETSTLLVMPSLRSDSQQAHCYRF